MTNYSISYSHSKLKFWRMREITPFLRSYHIYYGLTLSYIIKSVVQFHRPISLLPIISKVSEWSCPVGTSCLPQHPFKQPVGFQPGKNTTTPLPIAVHKWHFILENHAPKVGCILIWRRPFTVGLIRTSIACLGPTPEEGPITAWICTLHWKLLAGHGTWTIRL